MHRHPTARRAAGLGLLLALALTADAAAQPEVAPAPRLRGDPGSALPPGAVARVGRPRLRLPGAVINVAFAPTGTTFVSTGNPITGSTDTDRLVVLWDATTGREVRQFKGHTGGVEALAYSADGTRIATAGMDRTVRVWDVATGSELKKFTGHTDRILAVAYSPNGRRVASEAWDATIRIWDVDTGTEVKQLPGHKSSGTSNLRYSPDGKVLAAVGGDFSVRFWDPETATEVHRFPGPSRDSESLDFSPDGKRLAVVSEDGKLWAWDATAVKERFRVQAHPQKGVCVRFSPNGRMLATGGADGPIQFWDAETGKPLFAARGHGGPTSELSFSADGAILVSAGHEGTVRLWSTVNGAELPHSAGEFTRAALSPDGKLLATTGAEPVVRFWDPRTGLKATPSRPLDRPATAIAFSTNGQKIYASDAADELGVVDVAGGERIKAMGARTAFSLNRMSVGSPGRLVATTGGPTLRLWAPAAGGPFVSEARVSGASTRFLPAHALAVFPGDTHVAVSGRDAHVHVLEVATGAEVMTAPGQTGPPIMTLALACSPDGRTLVTTSTDRIVRFWEVVSGRERRPAVRLPVPMWAVAVSPDGRLVAVAGEGGFLALLDASTGKELARPAGHVGPVTYLAFTLDGRHLVSAGIDLPTLLLAVPGGVVVGDGTAVTWDVAALVPDYPTIPKPTAPEVDAHLAALGGADVRAADGAVWRLAAAPELAVPLLKAKLPAVVPGGADVSKLIAYLDDDDFDVREKATQELIRRGPAVAGAVRAALAQTKSREVRRRAEEVLATIGSGTAVGPDELLIVRGVEVLQRIDTPETRALLDGWAKRTGTDPLTREARIANARMRYGP
jgi:WD40 repeat protein